MARGKPAPDGYRLAARRLGVDALDCVVFEDAPPGVAAAREAGCRVVGLATTHAPAQLAGAATTVPDLRPVHVRADGPGYVVTVEEPSRPIP